MKHRLGFSLAAIVCFRVIGGYACQQQDSSADQAQEEITRLRTLPLLANAALLSGEIDKAVDYATQMIAFGLREHSTFSERDLRGNMIYHGNRVLGIVAIRQGDIDAAKDYLLLSGDTPGSLMLDLLGPNMSLAKELLDHGQKETVLAFLNKCKKFWNLPPHFIEQNKKLVEDGYIELGPDKWIRELEEGQTPDFSKYLLKW